jgi:hypothetical protein
MSLLKKPYKEFSGFLLLFIFCGYFGSTTFFPHTHIVDGVQVVHSHPYKSHKGDTPVNHNHSKQDYILIQFISNLIISSPIIFSGIPLLRKVNNTRLVIPEKVVNHNIYLLSRHLTRAPTF